MTDPTDTQRSLARLVAGARLSRGEADALFESLLSGGMDEAQIAALLALLQHRTPTGQELAGAADAMRRHVTPVRVQSGPGVRLIDTCGTGGAPKTFNISTAAAVVAAAARPDPASGVVRVVVAKHGNRSRTGRGSAEVLAALGVNVDAPPEVQARCLDDVGVCFCFAIHHHPAMRHAAAPRRSLGFPTVFNLLGPLTNPAGAPRQLIGVYAPHLVALVAEALALLGTERAMVVHAEDGLDELTVTAACRVAHVEGGSVRTEALDPATLGLPRAAIGDIRADGVEASANLIRRVLDARPGPASDTVALSAAAALIVAGAAEGWGQGLGLAREAIGSGRAAQVLSRLAEVSHGRG